MPNAPARRWLRHSPAIIRRCCWQDHFCANAAGQLPGNLRLPRPKKPGLRRSQPNPSQPLKNPRPLLRLAKLPGLRKKPLKSNPPRQRQRRKKLLCRGIGKGQTNRPRMHRGSLHYPLKRRRLRHKSAVLAGVYNPILAGLACLSLVGW